jgi:hypothetical protein
MAFRELLVVVPHSGILIPGEVPLDTLAEDFPALARNVDWYTDSLYDFRDLLGNGQVVFPCCSLILEGNRHPEAIEDCVPLKDAFGRPVYQPGREPAAALRERLARQHLDPFHQAIEAEIAGGREFLLDGHSTITARGVAANQIELMSFQHSRFDAGPVRYCPDVYIETYAAALRQRLPEIKVTVNESEYGNVYGHVCAAHSVNAMGRVGSRCPALLQETNDSLYRNADGSPNIPALNRLRRAFAEALHAMRRKVSQETAP